MQEEQVKQAAKDWQKALRLCNWDIEIEVLTRAEFDHKHCEYAGQGVTGVNTRDFHHRDAEISLVDTVHLEQDLVHEFSHMLLDPYQLLVEEVIEHLPGELKEFSQVALKHRLEESVNMVAKALLNARNMQGGDPGAKTPAIE